MKKSGYLKPNYISPVSRRITFKTVETVILLIIAVILLRFTVLQLGSYGSDSRRRTVERGESASTDFRTLEAIFNGDVFLNSRVGWERDFKRLGLTSVMVMIGILWATGFSFLLGYKLAMKPHGKTWDVLATAGTLLSGMPMFAAGLLLCLLQLKEAMLFPSIESFWYNIWGVITGGVILGSFEGALSEGSRSFCSIFSTIKNQTVYLAYRARGQSTAGMLYRAIRPFLIKSMGTKISYYFGGAIVVEKALEFPQLGYHFIENIKNPKNVVTYSEAIVSGLLIIAVPLIARMLLYIWSQRYGQSEIMD